MSSEVITKLMSDLDLCKANNSYDYLNWDLEDIAKATIGSSFENHSTSFFVDKLIGGYFGFKPYVYDRQLFNLLASYAQKGDTAALEYIMWYAGVKFHKGYAAQALGSLREPKAAHKIAQQLHSAITQGPHLVKYFDRDGITISEYIMMIEALKDIGVKDDYIVDTLKLCTEKAADQATKRAAKETLDALMQL